MAAVSCCRSPRLDRLTTATYYIPRTPIPGMRRMAAIDRSIVRCANGETRLPPFLGIKGTIRLEIFHRTDPLACLLVRARVEFA